MSHRMLYQNLAEFRYQIRRYLDFSTKVTRLAGIEAQQYQLMLALKGAPKRTVATIQYVADRMFIQHNSAVELVDRSVERGLVERHQNIQDLRRVEVRLTPKGEKVLRSLVEDHRTELLSAGSELLAALKPLLAGMKRRPVSASTLAPHKNYKTRRMHRALSETQTPAEAAVS
jgi:DNA-binding MarR family transcriptional regulator